MPTLVFVPCLHPALTTRPAQVLDGEGPVRSLWPGLPDPTPAESWLLPVYPYTPPEARACLADWKALVADKGLAGGFVPDEAALRAVLGRPHEERDLGDFVRTGTHKAKACTTTTQAGEPGHAPACEADKTSLCEAQRRLLMIWMQEEEVIAIRGLLDDYHHGMQQLSDTLGDSTRSNGLPGEVELLAELAEVEASDDLPPAEDSGFLPDDSFSLLPAWTFAVDTMAPFLPDDAVLYTADERLTATLDEWGIERVRLIPATDTAPVVSVVRLPLWQLAGKRGPSVTSPWLNRLCELRVVETQ